MDVILGTVHGNSGIMTSRGNVHLFEGCVARDFAIGDAVLGNPTCNANPRETSQFVQATQHVEDDLFGMTLHRSRQVHVVLGELFSLFPSRPEQFFEFVPKQGRHCWQVVRVGHHTVGEIEKLRFPLVKPAFF